VYACAQAEWGAPAVGNTLSLTVGYCAWSQATTAGTSYPTTPIVITFHDASGKDDQTTSCPSNPAGQTAPGNFGWTADPTHNPPTTPNPNCTLQPSDFTSTGSGYTYGGNTGNNTTSDCLQVLYNAYTSQAVQYIPVYAKYDGTGNNATYTLKGLAAFVVTGYYFGNNSNKNPPELEPSNMSCPTGNGNGKGNGNGNGGNSVTCISGYFVHQLDPVPGSLGTADLGLDIIKLTG
jgi:hypothetical protein